MSDSAPKPKQKTKKPPEDKSWRQRYAEAHRKHFAATYPEAYKGGHYVPPSYPDTRTANGLQNAIGNYMKYVGGMGNRINNIGIRGRKSTTINGTADMTCQTSTGKVFYCEIKVGSDRPRPEQLAMQKRVRAMRGTYEFVKTMIDFYYVYDTLMHGELFI